MYQYEALMDPLRHELPFDVRRRFQEGFDNYEKDKDGSQYWTNEIEVDARIFAAMSSEQWED